jgi:hypothetical protein
MDYTATDEWLNKLILIVALCHEEHYLARFTGEISVSHGGE